MSLEKALSPFTAQGGHDDREVIRVLVNMNTRSYPRVYLTAVTPQDNGKRIIASCYQLPFHWAENMEVEPVTPRISQLWLTLFPEVLFAGVFFSPLLAIILMPILSWDMKLEGWIDRHGPFPCVCHNTPTSDIR